MCVSVLLKLWMVVVLMSPGVLLQRVNMSSSSLTEIPILHNTSVTELILEKNLLVMSAADVRTLQTFSSLKLLDLSHNHIDTLPSGSLKGSRELEKVDLRGNQLQDLPPDLLTGLSRLKRLDLSRNPWLCSCSLLSLFRQINASGVDVGDGVFCSSPPERSGRSVLDGNSSCQGTELNISRGEVLLSTTAPHEVPSAHGSGWTFLLGVALVTLTTSALIVCAVKSPSWYKLLSSHRHHRLREDAERNQSSSQELHQALVSDPSL